MALKRNKISNDRAVGTGLTLKGAGFLVSQICGGGPGLILPGLRKRGLTPPNIILEQQTESHMKAEVFS